ncbi:MAG: hypothetical protein AB7S75_06035 [Desulfococcaceae bacterium]
MMNMEEFDYTDMYFQRYEKGIFHYAGTHEGCRIEAEFLPSPKKLNTLSLSAKEIFRDLGWTRVIIKDSDGKVIHKSG